MRILILNGPNLNLLGVREPTLYGTAAYEALVSEWIAYGNECGITVTCRQSNSEGQLIDWIQEAFFEGVDGLILNAGGYTHTSVALRDALLATRLPTVSVHITDPARREPFRRVDLIGDVCLTTIAGHGTAGYREALDYLRRETAP